MRFIESPTVELLFKETRIVLHVDNRYRGDVVKQINKINGLEYEYGLEIKKKRREAEPTAQGYIWQLISKIADKKNRNPVSVYKEFIKSTLPIATVYFENMTEASRSKIEWEQQGLGYMVLSMVDYREYVKCKRVRGYSGWTFGEVERFIEGLEKECNLLGLEGEDERLHKTVQVDKRE